MTVRRKAVITGASRGIGRSFALRCAKEGYDVLLVARNKDLLDECRRQIVHEHGVSAAIIEADLSKCEDVRSVASMIAAESSVEVLVNNAGFAVPSFFAESDIEAQLDMVRVHDGAMLRLTRAVLPQMKRNAKGIIVNVASTLAWMPFVANSVYCASKAFVNTFSSVLQREVRAFGIVVQSLNPGRTRTDFHNTQAFEKVEKISANVKEMTPDAVVEASFSKLGKKVIVVPGLSNRIMLVFGDLIADVFMRRKGLK